MPNKLMHGFLFLWFATTAAVAGTQTELCAPFEHTVVDETIVARMLASAKNGNLYRIQPSSSRVGFCLDSPFGTVNGRFTDFKGGLTFTPTAPTAEKQDALVLVDTRSLKTAGTLFENILKGEQFFDVDRYPEILFVSKQFRWLSDTEGLLIGDLTLRDVTREVDFKVHLINPERASARQAQEKLLVKATAPISRAQFGLDALSPILGDAVSLCIEIEALRYQSM